jgi:hypothetical protein
LGMYSLVLSYSPHRCRVHSPAEAALRLRSLQYIVQLQLSALCVRWLIEGGVL